jgi:tetratricopeptide (TPR) repeat protein
MATTLRKVFISYAHADGQSFARELSSRLSAAGHQPWRDEEQLRLHAGERWEHELTRQLLTADVIVAVLTPGAFASSNVEAECLKAMKYRLPVVPAVFLDCGVPLSLEPLQVIDFRSHVDSGFASLLQRLDRLTMVTEGDSRDLQTLRVMRTRASGANASELDALIGELAERIERFPQDVREQNARVTIGLAEERERTAAGVVSSAAAGARRSGRPPWNRLDSFCDRVDKQREIRDALQDPRVRLVTVLGRGGIGKTAVACYVLARMAAAVGESAAGPPLHGVAYLAHMPTQPITIDRLLQELSRVLPDELATKAERVFSNRDLSTQERVERFLDLLPGAGLIVALLDNFEDVLDERGRIRDADLNIFVREVLNTSAMLRLLVTTRAEVTLPAYELRAERQVALEEGLPAEDAITLLRGLDPNGRLGLRDAGDEQLMHLVHLTHSIPRALELVGNILTGEDDDGTFVVDINELESDFYARETVVEKLVEVNYARLRPEARRVLEAAAVFARPVPPVAIDFLLQPHVPGLRLRDVLQSLVSRRLVAIDRRGEHPGLISLHAIDRDFLYRRLASDGAYSRLALHARAAEYYRTQRTHGPISWRNLDQLEPQRFEFEHLVQASAYDEAAILLGEYAPPIVHCGRPTQCRDLFRKLPERFTSELARVSYALTGLVWKAYLGPIADGLKMGEDALRMAVAMNDLPLELRVREQLVIAYRYAHDGQRSRLHAERIGERIAEAPEALARTLTAIHQTTALDLVLAYTYAGDVRRAEPLARRAYQAALESGEEVTRASALNALAVLYFAWGRYADVIAVGREIVALWRPGFHDGIAYCKNLIGMSLYLLGDYAEAARTLADARVTADEWDSPRPEALALWNLSLVHVLHGVYDKALDSGRDANALMTRLGLDRAANAPRAAAEAAIAGDHPAMVRSLIRAAEEWVTCGDLFPGPVLADRAAQLARRHGLADLAAQADELKTQLAARVQLPAPDAHT